MLEQIQETQETNLSTMIDIFELTEELTSLDDWALIEELKTYKTQGYMSKKFYYDIDDIIEGFSVKTKLSTKDRKILEATYILMYADINKVCYD